MLQFDFSEFPVLHTERMVLCRIVKEDAEEMFRMRCETKGRKYLERDAPASVEEIHELIGKIDHGISNNEVISWAMKEKDSKKLIGNISFHKTNPQHHRAEIGYQLFSEYWNKGFASEAIQRVIAFGFEVMKLHSIEANVNPLNEVSIHLLQKFNFVKEAHFKENYFYNGKFFDTGIYSLLNNKRMG
ncbi:MAG: GNAT family N-acetyltransferase [Bacteroidetes bacterium]|nr:GNAT family N-acetyltransferase [Bacteroidota bacterium]